MQGHLRAEHEALEEPAARDPSPSGVMSPWCDCCVQGEALADPAVRKPFVPFSKLSFSEAMAAAHSRCSEDAAATAAFRFTPGVPAASSVPFTFGIAKNPFNPGFREGE